MTQSNKYKDAATVRLSIEGMHCGNCASTVEKKYQNTDGVYSVVVNLANNTAVVAYDKTKFSINDIEDVLNGTSFKAHVIQDVLESYSKKKSYKAQLVKLIFSIAVTVILILMSRFDIPGKNIIGLILTIPVQFICGWQFIRGAWKSLKSGSANMDVLVTTGTFIAFFYSLYLTITNTGNAFFDTVCMLIAFISLGEFIEDKAKEKTNKAVENLVALVPKYAKTLDVGDIVKSAPNSNIPVDGIILEGSSRIDESMLTGESDLIIKKQGDKVTGGTKNLDSELTIKVTHTYGESTLAKIVRAVSDAQATKAPVQRVADRVANVFVPVVLAISLITFICWAFIDINSALMCACSITIVACPCALVLATPTALTVGLGRGAQLGVILRSGSILELMCNIKHIVFDKTGTLTKADKTKELRDDAGETFNELKNREIVTYMVSGDTKDEAYRIAKKLNIQNVVWGADPVSKKDSVAKLVGSNKYAYVGDGINDAPSLAAADVGITLESGTDIALESGSVVLIHNKLKDIITAIDLSKHVMRKIKQNMFWALIYNVIVIPLAAFGLVMPSMCGAIHAISSLIVVFNSLLIKKFAK